MVYINLSNQQFVKNLEVSLINFSQNNFFSSQEKLVLKSPQKEKIIFAPK